MNNKTATEQDDANAEFSNSVPHARLQRKAKTGNLRTPSKHRAVNGRRKNLVAGGIHLRGNKRTLR